MHRKLFYWLLITLLTLLTLPYTPTSAQEGSTEEEINTLARAVHIQNMRTRSITTWIGGDLGIRDGSQMRTEPGNVLDQWELRDLMDASVRVNVNDLERPVLMNLWASWCGPCRYEFPFLANIALHEETNYDLWFVNTADTNESAAKRFLRDQEPGLLLYYDEGEALNAMTGMRVLPTTFLMDTDGTIIASHAGVVTPTVMRFFNAVAGNPRVGSIDPSTIEVGELGANLAPIDVEAATSMVMGQQVAGSIDDNQWQLNYRFEGQEGQSIVLEMTSTVQDFDAYMVLIGPDGERLVENDDGPVPPNAQIEITLPDSGTYLVVATRFLEEEGFSNGGFTLSLNLAGATTSNPNATASVLLANIPISGQLTIDHKQDAYLLTAGEGQEITFVLEHDLPDPTAVVNFQVRIGANERVVPFTKTEDGKLSVTVTMPQSTTYSIYVARPQDSRYGAITYTLTVQTETPLPDDESETPADESDSGEDSTADDETETNPAQGSIDSLEYGDQVRAEITEDMDAINYVFFGKTGDSVTIKMEAVDSNLDPMLYLLGPTGAVFAANDDNGDTMDALIPTYILPIDGEYTIVATSFASGRSRGSYGEFELSLEIEAPDVVSEPPRNTDTDDDGNSGGVTITGASIDSGDTLDGTLSAEVYEVRYTFAGEMGMVALINMGATDGNLDAYLILYNQAGVQIAFNDDNTREFSRDAGLSAVLPDDGTYTIVATRYGGSNGFTTGDFSLSFDLVEAGDLSDN